MNAKMWIGLTGLVAVMLIAAVMLVPIAFAQGPVVETPSFGLDSAVTPGSGPAFQMNQNGFFGPGQNGMIGRGARMGQRGMWQANGNGQGRGPGFVDEDGDGVCDHAGTGQGRGQGFVDEDGDGVCDHAGTGQGRGQGFVDEDGDGVCDHAGTGQGNGPGRGRQGRGMMNRWTQQSLQTN